MNAEYFLDSVKVRTALDEFAATWRSKRAKFGDKAEAFQRVLDLLNVGGPVLQAAQPAPPAKERVPNPESLTPPKSKAGQGPVSEVFTDPKEAGIDFDPFKDPLEPVEEPKQETAAERYERFKSVFKERVEAGGNARALAIWMDDDFPADQASRMADELGFDVNPENGVMPMAAIARVAGGGQSNGWKIRLLRR